MEILKMEGFLTILSFKKEGGEDKSLKNQFLHKDEVFAQNGGYSAKLVEMALHKQRLFKFSL